MSARGNSHAYYKAIKTVYGPQQSKKTCQTFLKKDGSYTNSAKESLERLKEYYYDLLNQNITTSYTTTQYLEELRRPICMKLDEIPTAEEFIKVIKEAKNHKTGTDHISIEILKYATSKHLKPMIFQLFLRMWETLQIPDSFLQLIMCSIFKKGDKRLCENQRGITLMSHLCKIFTLMLTKRAYKYCETINILPESQCAFRSNRSTVDMMFTAKLLQQSCREKEIALYLAFLDITKAYDSVDRETMWKILEIIGFPTKILSIFKLLYGEASCKIRWNGKFSQAFTLTQGLKQGCPAACLFFNIFFSVILFVIDRKLTDRGVQLRFRFDGNIFDISRLKSQTKTQLKTILELLFADDSAVCSTSEAELQIIISVFYETFKEFGLELAIKKTEVMMQKAFKNEQRPDPLIIVEGKPLKVVDHFKYLGGQLSNDGSMRDEIPWRIQQASASFSKLFQRVWKKKHIKLKTKIKTYKTMIMPCLLYGAETWNCTRAQIAKMNGLQYRQLRTISGKNWKDKVSHVELLQAVKFGTNQNFEWALPEDETKTPDLKSVETMIRLSRLRYTGHVMRMDNNRLPKIILHGEINMGKRKVGRPKQNFRSCIKEDLKCFNICNNSSDLAQLSQITSNRETWRKLINKGAEQFQKEWERRRVENSMKRKEK